MTNPVEKQLQRGEIPVKSELMSTVEQLPAVRESQRHSNTLLISLESVEYKVPGPNSPAVSAHCTGAPDVH